MITQLKKQLPFRLLITAGILILCCFTFYAKCQESHIKTAKVFKTGSEISDPIIELGSIETITLIFDDLSDNPISYSYTIVHCSNDWEESRLIKSDFMDGFDINPINDYQNSYSTTVPYTHYKLKIPNKDV